MRIAQYQKLKKCGAVEYLREWYSEFTHPVVTVCVCVLFQSVEMKKTTREFFVCLPPCFFLVCVCVSEIVASLYRKGCGVFLLYFASSHARVHFSLYVLNNHNVQHIVSFVRVT